MQDHKPDNLQLLMVLCKVCQNCDEDGLRRFVKFCSRYIKDSEFTKLIYTTMKLIIGGHCDKTPCEDWLISNLYKIYKTN